MYEPSGHQSANLAFLWPAFLAALASNMSALIAKDFCQSCRRSRRGAGTRAEMVDVAHRRARAE